MYLVFFCNNIEMDNTTTNAIVNQMNICLISYKIAFKQKVILYILNNLNWVYILKKTKFFQCDFIFI